MQNDYEQFTTNAHKQREENRKDVTNSNDNVILSGQFES